MVQDFISEFDRLIKGYQKDTDSIWAYWSQDFDEELPAEGFKIHISATVQNAVEIFRRVEKVLQREKVSYKVVSSLKNLSLLNSGESGYSQIGKFITAYPKNDQILERLLESLYRVTLGFRAVSIPSDYRYKNSDVVFYRYGEIWRDNGNSTDQRVRKIPEGITVPIADFYVDRYERMPENYVPLVCLRARGKSRVFQGISVKDKTAIIMKEGIMLGEVDPDGFDGVDHVMREKEILVQLKDIPAFPSLVDSFYVGNAFVIIEEFKKGKTLKQRIIEEEDLFLARHKNVILLQVLDLLLMLHEKEICAGDLSPDNLIIDDTGKVSVIDVEYYRFYVQKHWNVSGTAGFWCENYLGTQAVIYAYFSLWYYLSNPNRYRDLLLSESTEEKYGCNLNIYQTICSNAEQIINYHDHGAALSQIRAAVERG